MSTPERPERIDLEAIRAHLRSPFVPESMARLASIEGYLEFVWPRVASSVETAGFLGSALYMADMALDAVEQVYEPVLTRQSLLGSGLSAADLEQLEAVVDVFHYVQPQVLLVLAALAEAMDRETVGGYGKAEPRSASEREQTHLDTWIPHVDADAGPLTEVAEALGTERAPDLYRAVAAWPNYLGVAWEELQHLVAYPEFRRRGRGLYYYARSGARFLTEPLVANEEALRAAHLSAIEIAQVRTVLDESLPALAMMMMHAEAIRLTLGINSREVVKV